MSGIDATPLTEREIALLDAMDIVARRSPNLTGGQRVEFAIEVANAIIRAMSHARAHLVQELTGQQKQMPVLSGKEYSEESALKDLMEFLKKECNDTLIRANASKPLEMKY